MRLIQVKLTKRFLKNNFSLISVTFPGPNSQGSLTYSCVDKSHMALERTGQAARKENLLEVP